MRLGIDLGTTRTVVACADRGNYPIVTFEDENGDPSEHFPSVVAAVGGELRYGFDALAAAREGACVLRSFKRCLAAPDVTGATPIVVGEVSSTVLEVMTGFVRALRAALLSRSNLPSEADWSAVVAVPAHAHAAQRFLTLEAFRAAGAEVLALLNEPSAAGFEYTHRLARTLSSRRTRVVVYDLGGGTFDASLVRVEGEHHDVLATAGDARLGGDDFDEVLARCAAAAAGRSWDELSAKGRAELLLSAREAKEGIGPNKRRVTLDGPALLPGRAATVPVDDFYAAATPLVERSLDVMAPLLARLDDDDELPADVAGIYLVGGGSALPLVSRLLKERYGRRVHRSPYPGASTAIGLAIAADEASGFTLSDRFSRTFGVFREREGGRRLFFDALVGASAALPERERAVVVRRRYRAAHNLGHYRFVECPRLDAEGQPAGDLLPFGEVLFPFDPRLRDLDDLRAVAVERTDGGPLIEERYVLDASGLVEVEIADLDDGFARTYRLGGALGLAGAATPLERAPT